MVDKRVLIFGITGQIGSYIAELFLKDNYQVAGVSRRVSIDHLDNIQNIKDKIKLYTGDITDPFSLLECFDDFQPTIVINCAAQSEVGTSFSNPSTTMDITGQGPLNILEIIRKFYPKCRFLQFSSSEMMGSSTSTVDGNTIQWESTNMQPMSPYAVAKLSAHHMTKVYRESYGLFASTIIAFNSESPRRKDYFVTRKITKWLAHFIQWSKTNPSPYNFSFAEISSFNSSFPKLALGNIDSVRSWTHSKDTSLAAKLIVEHETPDDFCIGSNECYSVKDFLQASFELQNLNWKDYVYQDKQFMRPNDLTYLKPYPLKAFNQLGWESKISFNELVKEMVEADIEKAQKTPVTQEKICVS